MEDDSTVSTGICQNVIGPVLGRQRPVRVVRSTFRSVATSTRVSPSSISFRAWVICCGVSFRFRPNFTPRRFAAFHSRASAFGNQATFKLGQYANHLPHGADPWRMSMASVSDRNLTPRCSSHGAARSALSGHPASFIRSCKLRPNRSSFQTMSVSPCSSFFKHRSRQGVLRGSR